MVEWLVPPVVVNVPGIAAYAVPGEVLYRLVAFSFVVSERVACVVPRGRVPEGCPLERTGGVVSGPDRMALFIMLCTSLGGKSPAENAKLVHFSAEVMSGGMAANLDDMAGDIGRQIQSAAAAGDAVDEESDGVGTVDESHRDVVPQPVVGDGARGRDLAYAEAA